MSEPVFRLFASVVPVRGARRSTLCDLQRRAYHLIPNGLHEILTLHRDLTLAGIKAEYGPGAETTVDEYFRFLVEGELGFWCDEPEAFPELDLAWDRPERVTNAIIDVDERTDHPWAALLGQLDELGCTALQVRWFTPWPLERVEREVLAHTRYGRLRALELLLPFDPAWHDGDLDRLCRGQPRLHTVFVHGAPVASARQVGGGGAWICHRTDAVRSADHCGHVHPAYFAVTMECFTEAQKHNTCLNRKVSVDAAGEIRNCPALPASYGNARDTSLHAVVARRDFRALWEVNKDQIEVCKDCEFRYICTDCRAFVEDATAPYSKPSRCGYDPYTARWA
ncbi:MAG TPA: grasp-with-spasm system SPASM domain peptide maturase [Longimicrobium sp.]|nr:grasp-with-spasm system SPASM domain peptide maturase [Longimicrobium sp.]